MKSYPVSGKRSSLVLRLGYIDLRIARYTSGLTVIASYGQIRWRQPSWCPALAITHLRLERRAHVSVQFLVFPFAGAIAATSCFAN